MTWIVFANLSFAATVAGATIWYVIETSKLRKAQTEPSVVVYLDVRVRSPWIVSVVVKNVGAGIARDVSFSLEKVMIPSEASADTKDLEKFLGVLQQGMFKSGIPVLAPGQEIQIRWGMYELLSKHFKELPISVRVRSKSARSKEKYEASFELNLKCLSQGDADPIVDIVRQLERIERKLPSGRSPFTPSTPQFRQPPVHESYR